MKRNHVKTSRNCKTKIQLNIKSKTITNNFILTPRTASALEHREQITKLDRLTEDFRTERLRNEDGLQLKTPREARKHQYRMVTTDHPKINGRKKFQDEQTGTHTPLLKRVSLNSEAAKKKSDHSLNASERVRKRKPSAKPNHPESAELTKPMMQRLIGVIIKDYKEGRLKQKELEQTLLEIYDRRQKKKNVSKKTKKKESGYATFSNEFLRSNQNARGVVGSEVLVRKRPKNGQFQIHESVLERKGFVNKIIIKGITTSLFLREDQTTNGKESDVRTRQRESNYQILTSNSVQQINEQMKMLEGMYRQNCQASSFSREDMMAMRIQRAWRKYKTRQILKKISSKRRDEEHPFNILDEFTDQEVEYECGKDEQLQLGLSGQEYFSGEKQRQYDRLIKMVSHSLHQKDISKEECLKNILSYLNFPEEYETVNKNDNDEKEKVVVYIEENSEQNSLQERIPHKTVSNSNNTSETNSLIKVNKVEMIDNRETSQKAEDDNYSEQRSFTNKYPSKQVKDDKYYGENDNCTVEQLDESLTFAHSQTLAHQSFKSINILNIEEGLTGREEALVKRKDKDIEAITDKLFNNRLTKQQYLEQKSKIEKWFKTQQKQLKKIKNSLLKSCSEAKKLLESLNVPLKVEKNKKMMKCLSDKYINRQNWSIIKDEEEQEAVDKKQKKKKLHCEQREERTLKPSATEYDDEDQFNERQAVEKLNQIEVTWDISGMEITPKLSRHPKIEEKQYKYEQISKPLDLDEYTEGGSGKLLTRSNLSSQRVLDPSSNSLVDLQELEISLINTLVNETNRKLKYLCPQDKQDIYEFLFLDMMLQLFTDTYPGQQRIQRAALAFINRSKRLKKIPKGIKNGLPYSKDYLKFVGLYLLNQSNSLKSLSVPMGPSAAEMLKYMRDEFVQTEEESMESTLVLPISVFEKISKLPALELKLERYYDDEQRQQSRLNFLRTVQHISNKALFDSLNEMLDHERPYGVWGKPFPWKKELSLDKKWSKDEQENKLKHSVEKTIESCSYMCGILADKQDSLFGNNRVSEEYVMQIREDRLSKMLANELLQSEQRWIFYDDEETEILMEVSSFITRKLIKEAVLEIVNYRVRV